MEKLSALAKATLTSKNKCHAFLWSVTFRMTIHAKDSKSQNNSSASTMASLSAAAAANAANNNIGVMQIHPNHISATYTHTVAAAAAAAASTLATVNSDLDDNSDDDLRPTKGRADYVSNRDSNTEGSNLDPEKKSPSELAENEDFGMDDYNGP
eukprot:11388001-Ditylum_brightwellii.AAC.1